MIIPQVDHGQAAPPPAPRKIGAKSLKHLQENLAGADLELDQAATTRLDEVSAPIPDDYPYGPFGGMQRGRYVDSSEQVISELS